MATVALTYTRAWGIVRGLNVTAVAVVGIALLALGLRLWGIGAEPFNRDEVEEIWGALRPWSEIKDWSGYGTPTSLYLGRAWMTVVPHSEAWLRLLPVLANVAGVVMGFIVGRRLFGMGGGVIVGAILALSPTQVYYAREVNEYAWLALMSGLVLLTAERVHEDPLNRDRWALLGLAAAAALWMHVGTAFVSAGAALTLLPLLRNRSVWAGAVLGGAVAVVPGFILWDSLMAEKFANVNTYIQMFGGWGHAIKVAAYSIAVGATDVPLAQAAVGIVVVVAVYLVASGRSPLTPQEKRAVVYAAVPWVLFIGLSQQGLYSFADRYSLPIALTSALGIAWCVAALRVRPTAVLPFLAVLPLLGGTEPGQALWQERMEAQMETFSQAVQPDHCILSRSEAPIFRSMMRWYTGPDVPMANIADASLGDMAGCASVWVFASVFWDNQWFVEGAEQEGYSLAETIPANDALWNAQMTLAYRFTAP